ncbi:hypothetical protein [Dokdonella soli]
MSLLSGGSGSPNFTSTASGGTANSLFGDATSIYGAGKTLWQGFSGGMGNIATDFWAGNSGSVMNVGGMGVNMPYGGTSVPGYGGYGSGFG